MTEDPTNTPRQVAIMQVELTDPGGTIRGQVQIDTGPMRLADLVPTAIELTMVLSTRANQRARKEGKSISCAAGCGACCRQLVPVSPPEAFWIADVIRSLPPERRDVVMARFNHIASEVEERGMVEEMYDPPPTDGPILEISRKYFLLGMPCPFLEDESCSIHPYRPVACREYNVTSPAAWCADPFTYEIEKVPMPLPLSLPLTRMTTALVGSRVPLVPLSLVPQWVEQNAELGQRTWPGQELFNTFIGFLGAARKA
ncbi:MAG: hypothetical protein Kow0074_24150 [Candidatus Zixiibacteriota bacterium]